jgi:hypothetical protein
MTDSGDLFGFDPQELATDDDGRVVLDVYQTPAKCVLDLLPFIEFREGDTFMEPCKGDGNIYNLIPCDSDKKWWCEIRDGVDYLTAPKPNFLFDFIVTNPPFNKFIEFLLKSMSEAQTVIYLLPLNSLGSKERREFWNEHPPSHLLPLSERPVFIWVCSDTECNKNNKGKFAPGFSKPCPKCGSKIKSQTDSLNYAWFCWDWGGRIKINTSFWVI